MPNATYSTTSDHGCTQGPTDTEIVEWLETQNDYVRRVDVATLEGVWAVELHNLGDRQKDWRRYRAGSFRLAVTAAMRAEKGSK